MQSSDSDLKEATRDIARFGAEVRVSRAEAELLQQKMSGRAPCCHVLCPSMTSLCLRVGPDEAFGCYRAFFESSGDFQMKRVE